MGIAGLLLIVSSLSVLQIRFLEASYQCGIRKHSFVQLVHHGWKVEEGQWPWHVALFHKTNNGSREYACGGTLITQKHILTAAHCVRNRNTGYPLPESRIELHFGQKNLSKNDNNTQIRDVFKVHIHPEFSTHRNDIAVLVTRLPVEYTEFILPICMDQRPDKNLQNLIGKRGWITGWGMTQNGTTSAVLRTTSMPVVDYLQCIKDNTQFGIVLDRDVFCAGDRNGTSPGTGDSGGGMYFIEGDRWVLRGIVSFAKADESQMEVDTSKYAVFVNLNQFLTWIKEITDEPRTSPKRISEIECDRFRGLATKRANGLCANSRYPHTVSIVTDNHYHCVGALINENHVLTLCTCKMGDREIVRTVRIHVYKEVEVEEFTCHPDFHSSTNEPNLAVIKMKTSINLSSSLIPACLASNWTENLYDTLLQTGFAVPGLDTTKLFIESYENNVISLEECVETKLYPHTMVFTIREAIDILFGDNASSLCVMNSDLLRTEIRGTHGSPLQSVNSRTCMCTIVGLLKHSSKNLKKNGTAIDVYTRVSSYLDWIEEIVWNVKPSMATTTTSALSSNDNWS